MSKLSFENIWKNKWLLISGMAAICLFFGRIFSKILAIIGILSMVALVIWCILWHNKNIHPLKSVPTILLGVLCDGILVYKFVKTWLPSQRVSALANKFHLSSYSFLLVLGVIVGVISLYFICYILSLVLKKIRKIYGDRCITDIHICFRNIKSNWYIPISALALFCLGLHLYLDFDFDYIGIIIAFLCIVFISSQKHNIISSFKNEPLALKIFAGLSAAGMCLAGKRSFYNGIINSNTINSLTNMKLIGNWISIIGAVAGFLFAFLFILTILSFVLRKIQESQIIKRISCAEWLLYFSVFVLFIILTAIAFLQSQAFYGTEYDYDIIYTSDSPVILKNTADLCISYAENDIRQPLFAVFAAPFTGGMYFVASVLSKIFHISNGLFYTMENIVQIALLLIATILIVDMMKLKKSLRICLFIVLCSSYTMLLSVLMVEQYIVAYFWLVFAIYAAIHIKENDPLPYYAATGTLLTSAAVIPLYRLKKANETWKSYFRSLLETGFKRIVEFVFLLITFSRFDVIYRLTDKINQLTSFTGYSVSFSSKLLQYINFVSNCFISPNAGIDTTTESFVSWQLALPATVNILGIIILILVAISIVVNKKDFWTKVSACWVFFSFLMLFVLGWGTAENGLILYSLYFHWAFCILLFKLVNSISNKIGAKYLTHIISIVCCIAMLIFNIPGIRDLINFAITYYPA